jgi:hypothetical protein
MRSMIIDAHGRLWLDNPLLVLGILSLLWVLIACLHTEPQSVDRRRNEPLAKPAHVDEWGRAYRVTKVAGVRVARCYGVLPSTPGERNSKQKRNPLCLAVQRGFLRGGRGLIRS